MVSFFAQNFITVGTLNTFKFCQIIQKQLYLIRIVIVIQLHTVLPMILFHFSSVAYPFSQIDEKTDFEEPDLKDFAIDLTRMQSKDGPKICQDSGFGASGWTQFYILFYRSFLANIRDNQLFFFRIFAQVGIGLLLGFLYQGIGNDSSRVEDNIAMLFFCILFSLFTAMMPTIMTYPSEMKTFKREYLNNWYSIGKIERYM